VEFTGERYVPATAGIEDLYLEHVSRYIYAAGLARDLRVLDVGCGCGYGTYHLALCGASLALGVDVSDEAVGFAREHYRHPTLRFEVADASTMEVGSGFDLVTCFETIEHVDDAPAVLGRIAAAMSRDGVLLTSTPNKEVYVAGGKGGANPFHRREYTGREFEDLLGQHFAHVAVLGQHWTEGIAVLPAGGCRGRLAAEIIEDDGSGSGALSLGDQPLYFIGVCARTERGRRAAAKLGPLATMSGAVRHRTLKRHLRGLEAEFDKRGRWARSLDEEIARRDRTIMNLRAEVEELRAQCGEGTPGVPPGTAAEDEPIKEKV
jgi:SAM-dependent methyltransferase